MILNRLVKFYSFQLYFWFQLFLYPEKIILKSFLFIISYLYECSLFLCYLPFEILQPLKSMLPMVTEKSAMRTYSLFIWYTNNVKWSSMQRTKAIAWIASAESIIIRNQIIKQLVFLFMCQRLLWYRHLAEWKKYGGTKGKYFNLIFYDSCGAKTANDDILPSIYDFADAGLADWMFAAWQFSW